MSNLNKRSKPNRFKQKNTSLNKTKVLSMFLAMEQRAAQDAEDFFTSGRTGRRNAMADILGVHATTTTADIPDKLQALTTKSSSESKDEDSMSTASSSHSVESSSALSVSTGTTSQIKETHKSKPNPEKPPGMDPDKSSAEKDT